MPLGEIGLKPHFYGIFTTAHQNFTMLLNNAKEFQTYGYFLVSEMADRHESSTHSFLLILIPITAHQTIHPLLSLLPVLCRPVYVIKLTDVIVCYYFDCGRHRPSFPKLRFHFSLYSVHVGPLLWKVNAPNVFGLICHGSRFCSIQ